MCVFCVFPDSPLTHDHFPDAPKFKNEQSQDATQVKNGQNRIHCLWLVGWLLVFNQPRSKRKQGHPRGATSTTSTKEEGKQHHPKEFPFLSFLSLLFSFFVVPVFHPSSLLYSQIEFPQKRVQLDELLAVIFNFSLACFEGFHFFLSNMCFDFVLQLFLLSLFGGCSTFFICIRKNVRGMLFCFCFEHTFFFEIRHNSKTQNPRLG